MVVALLAHASYAAPLRTLGEEAQSRWAAIGHLQGPGFRMKRGCSGTLIAADLVVTAAHCLTGALWQSEKQQFRAGLYKDSFAARRTYSRIEMHPLYNRLKGNARIPYDIAVVYLSQPISPSDIKPIPLISPVAARQMPATLLGYRHDRPNVMSGRQNCGPLLRPHPGVMLFDCQVVAGTSGGAVIFETPKGPELAGVIVARHGNDGNALAVPVNTWLREKLSQALAADEVAQ